MKKEVEKDEVEYPDAHRPRTISPLLPTATPFSICPPHRKQDKTNNLGLISSSVIIFLSRNIPH